MNNKIKPCPFCSDECSLTAIERWNTRYERTCYIESSTYDEECDCFTTKMSCGCVVIDGWSFHGKYCPECGAKVVN